MDEWKREFCMLYYAEESNVNHDFDSIFYENVKTRYNNKEQTSIDKFCQDLLMIQSS